MLAAVPPASDHLVQPALDPRLAHRRALLLAGALQLAAGVGVAYLAGFGEVRRALGHFDPRWQAAMVGALGLSLVGNYLVYREIY